MDEVNVCTLGLQLRHLAGERPDHGNRILLGLLEENSVRRNRSLLSTVQEILVEGPDQTGERYTGRTRGNRVTVFEGTARLVGTLAPLKISRASVSTLYGELV